MSTWPEPCPRCGSYRLIGRETVVSAGGGGSFFTRLRLRLRSWSGSSIIRRTYHCGLCGFQWTRDAWPGEDHS